jgi:hypothetical protein
VKNIYIQTSGVLEKFGITVDDVLRAQQTYVNGFLTDGSRNIANHDICEFTEMLLRMNFKWSEIIKMLQKAEKEADQIRPDIDVKKAAGTYEGWIKEITIENEQNKDFVEGLIGAIAKSMPPIRHGNMN